MVGEGEPSQRRDFQPLCRAAMPPVPDAVEARGLLPTFGDNTGIDDQGLCMCRGDHVEDRRLVEGDKVNVSGVPTGKGSFVIRTVAAEISKRRMAWEQQQQSPQMGQKLLLRLRGLA